MSTASTEIEIGLEPMDILTARALRMDERHHVLPEAEWVRHIGRVCGVEDLFVYQHQETLKFVLAQWCVHPSKVSNRWCQELDTMEEAPDRGGWISPRIMEMQIAPRHVIARKMTQHIRNRDAVLRQQKMDNREEWKDAVRYARRQGLDGAAAMLETQGSAGFTGKVKGGEAAEAMEAELKSAASERIITHG